MIEWRVAAANALGETLDNFHKIDVQILRAVWRVIDEGCFDKVIMYFDRCFLTIEARGNSDAVEFCTQEGTAISEVGADASKSNFWARFIGKPLGWGWVTINQQGYW